MRLEDTIHYCTGQQYISRSDTGTQTCAHTETYRDWQRDRISQIHRYTHT